MNGDSGEENTDYEDDDATDDTIGNDSEQDDNNDERLYDEWADDDVELMMNMRTITTSWR